MPANHHLTFIDFFAGIGGARRGLELAGHKCIGFCEYDKFAVASYTAMHLATDEQLEYLTTLPMKQRQKEILKQDYRNGEWYANDIRELQADDVPKADCWVYGAPCQSFSVAGKREGLNGESGLIKEIFRLLHDTREEDRPEWLIYENVKGMFSSNRGFDFLGILLEMESLGYDIEWFLFNSKYHGVPQNRERVYTVGHLRSRGSAKVFPFKGTDRENSFRAVNLIGHRDGYRCNTQVFAPDGITETLSTCAGGGREHHTIVSIGKCDPNRHSSMDIHSPDGIMSTLDTLHEPKRIAHPIGIIDDQGRTTKQVTPSDTASTLRANTHGNEQKICIPVLTPDRAKKRQNGRRFKEDGEEAFTLTAQDRHGVAVSVNIIGHQVTDLTDEAHCLNANDQRKKTGAYQERTMAGTIIDHDRHDLFVVDATNELEERPIANCIESRFRGTTRNFRQVGNLVCMPIDNDDGTDTQHPSMYVQLSDDVTVYAVWYPKKECYIAVRKLTPRECFRLQGWTDDYFDKAQLVNSDSQLYKQAGNGITVNVAEIVGRAISDCIQSERR